MKKHRSALRLIIGLVIFLFVYAAVPLASAQNAGSTQSNWSDLKLWYNKPAPEWNHALPVGNGRFGAMVLGETAAERIQLNEETFWAGGPYDPTQTGGAEALPEIQRLLFAGEVDKAHDLFGRKMMGKPYEQMKYQSLGDFWMFSQVTKK